MFKFTRAGVNLISFSITTIIFLLIQIFMYQYSKGIEMNIDIRQEMMQQTEKTETQNHKTENDNTWEIEIEKIQLKANISEGTTKEVLSKNVGHFEETQKEKGNIGLAAHNRGYEVNYFEKLKLLKKGDEIKYKHNEYKNTYEITKNIIIKDTDWTELENTEENMLTLITCIENEPNYRRCIKAIEKDIGGRE